MRSNAQRLLGDVQAIHSRMVAELDRVDGGASRITSLRPSGRDAGPRRRPPDVDLGDPTDADVLDVPEFIPPG
jgi:hypothetical protein